MFTSDSVTVVTPATGHRNLPKCLESVQRQTFENVEHVIVVDGKDRQDAVDAALAQSPSAARARQVIVLPQATGKEKWNGHRIYGAMSLLCNSEFIAFLDEDNWYDPEHIEEILRAIRAQNAAWGFSLRKLWNICRLRQMREPRKSSSGGVRHEPVSGRHELLRDSPRAGRVTVASLVSTGEAAGGHHPR
jgi:glycosyltransferase involved in cell wall biosynthesis